MVTRSREVQFQNTPNSGLSSLLPNIALLRAVQLSNAKCITIVADGKLMLLKDLQCLNASLLIISSLSAFQIRQGFTTKECPRLYNFDTVHDCSSQRKAIAEYPFSNIFDFMTAEHFSNVGVKVKCTYWNEIDEFVCNDKCDTFSPMSSSPLYLCVTTILSSSTSIVKLLILSISTYIYVACI